MRDAAQQCDVVVEREAIKRRHALALEMVLHGLSHVAVQRGRRPSIDMLHLTWSKRDVRTDDAATAISA